MTQTDFDFKEYLIMFQEKFEENQSNTEQI